MSRLLYFGLLLVIFCSAAATKGHEVETKYYDTISTSNVETKYDTTVSEETVEESTDESSESEESSSDFKNVEVLETETTKESTRIKPIEGCTKCPPNEIFLLKKKSCPPDTCESLVARYDCSKSPPPKPGCTCKSGYKRLNGKCVPICQCPELASTPECNPTCNGPNEEFVQEKSTCPGDTCRALVIRVDCSTAPPPQPGCTCKSGFFRKFNETSPCVPICECPEMASSAQCAPPVTTPKPLSCGLNEVEVCAYRCPPEKTCRNRNIAYRCARDDKPCQKKCVCKPGYFRNSIGECITKAQCEQCSKPHEFYSCGSACDNDCKTIQYQNRTNCPIINIKCNEKCYCEDGYARDDKGNCIPVSDCKCPQECPENEVFELEKRSCPPDTCESIVSRYDCSKSPPPAPGCTCKSGYKRLNGKCVPICQCPELASTPECNPTCNGPNEEFVQEKSTCPGDTCRALVIKVDCSTAPPPQPGCRCKSGFFRKFNETSPCVPICECPEMASSAQCAPPVTTPKPLSCGLNEVEVCAYRCPPEKTCRNRNIAYRCARDDKPCQKKCVCKPGYFRNSIGECITKAQCEQCSKPHEFYSCGSACDNDCKTIQYQNRTNCPIINIKCNEKCYCEDGYARDDKGNCIPVSDCKCPQECPENEVFELEKRSCPPDTCKSIVSRYDCSKSPPPAPGCTCKSGYKRLNGKCVPICQCPELASTPECNPTCNDPNEEFVQEKSTCPGDTCRALVIRVDCSTAPPPQPGCRCKSGFFRKFNETSPCVPICECPEMASSAQCLPPVTTPKPSSCGLNEVEVCAYRCPPEKTCRNRNIIFRCARDDKPCQKKCVCKPGYFRNSIGECITKAQCEQCSKPNEFYSCGSACDNDCKTIQYQNRTNCPIINIKCNEKCYCEDGYARDDKGNCIPVSECILRPPGCGLNEEEVCSTGCPPEKTCQNRNEEYACPAVVLPCKMVCQCKPGYIRNDKGVCVTEGECANLKCGINEEAVTVCPTCPPGRFCAAVVRPCQTICQCKKGYFRNDNGICVETTLNCGYNEVEACVRPCPPQQTCRNRNIAYLCIKDNKPCQRKCVCKPWYFRNSIGQCITEDQCDQCSKPHEFFTCGPECDNECRTLGIQNRTNCPIINKKCNEKCYCEDGYARDNKGNCIPVDQCQTEIKCPENEELVPELVTCPPDTCRALVQRIACPSLPPPQPGCTCISGYRRLNGKCVPICQCPEMASSLMCKPPATTPKPSCCGLNEEEKCVIPNCPENTCSTRNVVYDCFPNEPCTNQCRCKRGFYRNAIGECISNAQCDICTKPHEFFTCGPECDNECRTLGIQNRTNCPIINKKCNEKCYCEDGYARDNKGNCIPVDQCCNVCSDPNEEYVLSKSCPPDLCFTISASYSCPDEEDQYRCRCKSGFLRKKEGSPCIPINQCGK